MVCVALLVLMHRESCSACDLHSSQKRCRQLTYVGAGGQCVRTCGVKGGYACVYERLKVHHCSLATGPVAVLVSPATFQALA